MKFGNGTFIENIIDVVYYLKNEMEETLKMVNL